MLVEIINLPKIFIIVKLKMYEQAWFAQSKRNKRYVKIYL